MFTLPIFYHTSTLITVDDDDLILKSLALLFKNRFMVMPFHQPKECIKFFDSYRSPLSKTTLLQSCTEHEQYDSPYRSFINFDMTQLHLENNKHERKNEISVMIVDYNMPGMNGIELCKILRTIPVKKILLTGEASLNEAVAAFNDKVIDCFIRKDSPSLAHQIQHYVKNLSLQYYREQTNALCSHLEANGMIPLSDPIFAQHFSEWCASESIQEYTLIDRNGSLMAMNNDDQASYFIVHTDQSLDAFLELNDDVNDAEPFLQDIKQRKLIPFFGTGKECWEFQPNEWQPYLYPPTVLNGREKYYWAIVK